VHENADHATAASTLAGTASDIATQARVAINAVIDTGKASWTNQRYRSRLLPKLAHPRRETPAVALDLLFSVRGPFCGPSVNAYWREFIKQCHRKRKPTWRIVVSSLDCFIARCVSV
jgi:hypothetical protein